MQANNILKLIDRPNYKSEHLKTYQNASDIIAALKRAEFESRATSNQLAKVFNEQNKMNVAKKVWEFLRNNITYYAEPKTDQNAKTISRFLNDKIGDCKMYSVTSVGILNACGIPCWFSFIGQQNGIKKPNHAYATCLIDGKNVVIDPCRDRFNSEAKYFYKWDIKRK